MTERMTLLDKFKLRGPRILVKQLAAITATASGLLLPETQSGEIHHRGIVERIGPGEQLPDGQVRPVQNLQVGDLVYFAKFAGTSIVLDGQPRLMLMEDELQGAIDAMHITLVTHPDEARDGEADHLEGEPCAICFAKKQGPIDAAARERLGSMRESLIVKP